MVESEVNLARRSRAWMLSAAATAVNRQAGETTAAVAPASLTDLQRERGMPTDVMGSSDGLDVTRRICCVISCSNGCSPPMPGK